MISCTYVGSRWVIGYRWPLGTKVDAARGRGLPLKISTPKMGMRVMCFSKARTVILFILLIPVLAGQVVAQAPTRTPELNQQFHRAETAWRSGTSMLEAKARVDRVLKELPDDAPALKLRAEVLLALQRPNEALADAQKAVALNPRDGEAQVLLCEAARLSGDKKLSLRAMDAASECVIDDPAVHVRLSWNAVELGDMSRAEAFARIALAQNPREAAGYYQLSRVFILQNKTDQAAQIILRGLKASVLDPAVIARDEVLGKIVSHPTLEQYF